MSAPTMTDHSSDQTADQSSDQTSDQDIAVISLAGRFPGAPTIEAFWENLRGGVESVTAFTDAQLEAAGVPEHERRSPDYVPCKAVLPEIAEFDAGYFGISPREASLIDPQQRLFLEVCVELLERAALGPGPGRDRTAVFGGVSKNTYMFINLLSHPELRQSPAALQMLGANEKDYLATRVSHKLGLRGPSLTVQTACSSSLVAVHLACQSLRTGESDYAIAGGVAVDTPHIAGYVYEPGGIFSPDGHCRAFDADARGTVFGQGAGAVLLRRLADAVADGDDIHAVILGSAVNNDGDGKAGFTAPSVEGQAAVIVEALANADVDPSTVGYVEAHGTGTALGDPIEVEALTRAYRLWTDRTGFARIGSVKTNIGHLNAASGIAGLIKTVLALRHAEIPPLLHYSRPNPQIDFAETPFTAATGLTPWPSADGAVRRAGVSSFGIGGTNVHLVLQSAPEPPAAADDGNDVDGDADGWQLIPLSARTPGALNTLAGDLADAVETRAALNLADAAYSHQVGRRRFPYRAAVIVRGRQDAVRMLGAASRRASPRPAANRPPIAFLFPGQGAQYPELARGLYADEPLFRREFDACSEILSGLGAADPRELLRATDPSGSAAPDPFRTDVVQPQLFVVEYALARLWSSWGIEPDAVAGHSLGEVTAAAIAGVFDLEDALRLVAERARLMSRAPAGAMLAVACRTPQLPDALPGGVELASVNSDAQLVLAGPESAIAKTELLLAEQGIVHRRMPGRHAFHSSAMDEAADALAEFAVGLRPRAPRIPLASNLTGTWLRESEALNPGYWGRQLRETVLFREGLGTLLATTDRVLLEVGPGRTLGRFARRHAAWSATGHRTVGSLPDRAGTGMADRQAMLTALGELWEAGAEPSWPALHNGTRRRPVALPTYPFERSRHWIDPLEPAADTMPRPIPKPASPSTGSGPSAKAASPQNPANLTDSPDTPEAEIERRVTQAFESLLGVASVQADDDFFALGGHSLLGVELTTRLRDTTGVELPLSALFDQPTPAAISALVLTARRDGISEALARAGVDSAADIRLDDDLVPPATAGTARRSPGSVLLTGATGFLGTFLLHELLRQGDAVVECVVRCADPADGLSRLAAGLGRYGLADDTDLSRIRVVPGDISQARFGVDRDEYQRLARTVDTIYHNGAKVSFLEPYRLIRRTNVTAVREVLRLAAEHTLKPIHHVSTIAVFDCTGLAHVSLADEDENLAEGGGFHGGYDESKWVAERILGLARERGFPITVYRPGNIAGHSVTGAVSDGHLVTAMITGCVALGVAPDVEDYVDVVPVDYVSRALVHLSLRESAQGHNFHLVNPAFVRWSEIADQLRAAGYPLAAVSLPEWREAVRARGETDNPMRPFLPMLDERALFSGRRYDSRRAAGLLSGSGISCPPLDSRLIGTYLSGLIDSGALPPPPGAVRRPPLTAAAPTSPTS